MKKENDNNLDRLKVNYINLLEIIFFIYCVVLLKNTIPTEFFKIVNYRLNTRIINKYILVEIAQSNVYHKIKNIELASKSIKKIIINKKINFEEKLICFNNENIINFNSKYEVISKINILQIYIIDTLFFIVYYIYSKSRKKVKRYEVNYA